MIQTNFNDLEAVKIAIQIEERGEAFYERSIPLVSNDEVKNMLAELAEQERDHAAAFREIYNELVKKSGALMMITYMIRKYLPICVPWQKAPYFLQMISWMKLCRALKM